MNERGRRRTFVAALLGLVACNPAGDGGEPTSSTPSASAARAPAPPPVREVSWDEVRAWTKPGEICWAIPIAQERAYVTRCDGHEIRTRVGVDELTRWVEQVDPSHQQVGFTTYYREHVEIDAGAAATLFASGTVWEVEVNQNLRALLATTSLDGSERHRYATVFADRETPRRLAALAPGPMFVKLFFVEEIPWGRAAALIASGRITSAGSAHVNRAFLRDTGGHEYLSIPSPPESLGPLLERFAPDASFTVE